MVQVRLVILQKTTRIRFLIGIARCEVNVLIRWLWRLNAHHQKEDMENNNMLNLHQMNGGGSKSRTQVPARRARVYGELTHV